VRILDLFCGGGGAAEGYRRAFPHADIIGVDIADHSDNYPGEFVCGDALDLLEKFGREFDFIHASPPCQAYSPHVSSVDSKWVPTRGKAEPRLIDAVRDLLLAIGTPYVIENVMGARTEMHSPVLLCGSMFGLPITRHRLFETSFPVDLMPHQKCSGIAKRFAEERGWEYRDMSVTGKGRRAGTTERWREIMGINHPMTQAEIAEAIPPAYTEWIGRQFADMQRLRNDEREFRRKSDERLIAPFNAVMEK
jgi:DNA (cytosine-5)-methyltransferase 1